MKKYITTLTLIGREIKKFAAIPCGARRMLFLDKLDMMFFFFAPRNAIVTNFIRS